MTAVEWLVDALTFKTSEGIYTTDGTDNVTELVEQAKEMEIEQLKKFYHHGMFAILDGNGHGEEFIDYFEKTFKQK